MIDKNLLRLLGNNKKYIFKTVLLMVAGLIANIALTACICFSLYLLINKSHAGAYLYPAIISAVMIVLRYFITCRIGGIKDLLAREVKKDLRERIYEKVVEMGVCSGDKFSMASLTQMSMEGVEQLDLYYSTYIPQFLYAMIAPLILFIVTVFIDWKFSVVILLCVPLIPISIMLVSKYAKKIFSKYWDKYISMGDSFLDSVQGLKDLKIFKADEKSHEKMNKNAEEFRKITMKVLVMQLSSTTIMDLVAYAGAGLGITMVVLSLADGNIAPYAALFLVLEAVEFFLPLRAFGSAFHIAMNGAGAGTKILSLLESPVPEWGNDKAENYNVEIKDVTFSYDGKRDVLKNINIKLPDKGMTAIVGESGCGKSTIVNILLGVCRPEKGTVTIGGKNIASLKRESYYENIAVVSYNTYLFHTTIRENFRLAKENVTDDEIREALKKVNLPEFTENNGGLDKMIDEDAKNISGGQKQRLALAVSMVSDKKIYIFDEATSNIDIESESIIMENIKKMAQTKSVIIISHRLFNIIKADNIIYMENGMIKECGNHESLMNNDAGYKKLYTTQKNLEKGYLEVQE